MKKYTLAVVVLVIALLFSQSLYADCRGCCSRKGGVVCVNGVTRCEDGSALTQTCLKKNCNVCPETGFTQQEDENTITIASFNIQVFGRSKAKKIEVMEILAETIARYDIVAIQEIRDKTGTAIEKLEDAVDDLGIDYTFIIGPRLGRTSSKEQYAFFYKPDVVEVLGTHTFIDIDDKFHREPFIVHFKVVDQKFDFAVINIHTDPDEAKDEINDLPGVISHSRDHFQEQDIILLGDLNADGKYYKEDDGSLPMRDSNFIWLIKNEADTAIAKSDNTYDRIIITPASNEDHTNNAGVFRFDLEFELDCEPKEVSDHYPVFAEFSVNKDSD